MCKQCDLEDDVDSISLQAAEALDLDLDDADTLGRDELEQVLLGHFMVDYWVNLAVCHSLIVEDHPSLGKVYQVGCSNCCENNCLQGLSQSEFETSMGTAGTTAKVLALNLWTELLLLRPSCTGLRVRPYWLAAGPVS